MTDQVDVPPTSRRAELAARRARVREAARQRRRRRATVLLAVVLPLLAVVAGGAYLFAEFFGAEDFDGAGTGEVVVQVRDGDSTRQIGASLQRSGVVASVEAFTEAAEDQPAVRSVQPGYYEMRRQMSGRSAVERLLDPVARVGQLEIRGGVQLDDTLLPDGSTAPGVLSLISQATCAQQEGVRRCVSVDELRAAVAGTDPAQLGVPDWALERVRAAEPSRRLEGLLMPGRYDVAPGQSAAEVLRTLLTSSRARLTASGLVGGAQGTGYAPYQVLVIASLVEKEGIAGDFGKVSRVIYNRLAAGQRLELDSTVNYPLDLQLLRTSPDDRARSGPYNSYAVAGLPPTPIAAPSTAAIAAAVAPEPGPWLFFVRCRPDGTSCFSTTYTEHEEQVRAAIAAGVF